MDKSGDSTPGNRTEVTKAADRNYRKKNRGGGEEANESGSDTDDKSKPGSSRTTALHKLKKCTERRDTDSSSVEGTTVASETDNTNMERYTANKEGGSGGVANCSDQWPSDRFGALIYPMVLKKIKSKCTFSVVNETVRRQIGQSNHFQRRFYGSLRTVERLQFLHSLKEHKGCVNTVEFNEKGDLLVSGSDDLVVCVWNWATGRKCKTYESGHRDNIFQASWLPHDNVTKVITCASDGQVRLLDLVQGTTRQLVSHYGACNKFATHPDTPQFVLSVGNDGNVLSVDVRGVETTILVPGVDVCSADELYAIHSNPRNSHEFCVGGHSDSFKIYDRRNPCYPVSTMGPKKLIGNNQVYITAVTYNYNGTEILASYNDDDIYLFNTLNPHPAGDYAHKYEGHRNSKTIKGVSYFGPNSEFIVSGSDCGNIFFWEKNTQAIVQCVRGIAEGVVNCVKPHPTIPVLASSGLDDDIKIWLPSAIGPPPMTELKQCLMSNLKDRVMEPLQCRYHYEGNSLFIILEKISQNREPMIPRSRREVSMFDVSDDDDDDYGDDGGGDADDDDGGGGGEDNYDESDFDD